MSACTTNRAFDCRGSAAFTIAETVLWMAVALLILGGLLSAQLFAQRMWDLTQMKVNASDNARQIVRLVSSDVRTAKIVRVGSGNAQSFTEASNGVAQSGNALQIYPSTDTNVYVRYFRDAADYHLKYVTNGTSMAQTVARSISNSTVFRLEDHTGTLLSNRQQKSVVDMRLNFYALDNPPTPIGAGKYYKSYTVRTKIAQQTQ